VSYVHLHLHTQYSLLDGANKITELMPRMAALNMPAAAMTDHGNMFGAIDFYRSATAAGIKPIIGCEVYVAPGKRTDRTTRGAADYESGGNYHLVLLAANMEGYRNLCRMVSQSYKDGFYYKPRIDKELLEAHNSGLLCLSGCLSGEAAKAIVAGRHDKAREVIEYYARLFGDRYYLEIQDNHLEEQNAVNEFMIPTAHDMGIPLVATNDCHYLDHDDHKSHEVLLCVQTGKQLDDEDRWRFGTDQLFVKGAEDMLKAFPGCEEAISNTVGVADRCNVEFEFGKHKFPNFAVGPDTTLVDHFCKTAREGLENRLGTLRSLYDEIDEDLYRERLETELECIVEMDFPGYFLIVSDFINWAKAAGIPVGPGRGSAAGSLVSYSMRITDIDPLRWGLLFERFLNPERQSMPDIDVDFCYQRRDEVLNYVREKYGTDKVANIITFGTLKGKAAIRDVGRVLGMSFGETDRVCKLYPAPRQGRDFNLTQALEMEPRMREYRDSGEREGLLFQYALKLEGLTRHVSKHAAGVVIGNEPLVESVPLFVDNRDGTVVTQFAGPDVEALGLIKFDFLGLKTLTLIADTVSRVEKRTGVKIDIDDLPLDDAATYRLASRADAVGLFQMESGGMRKLLQQIKPSSFEDLIAILALFRPGPLDSGMVEQYIKRRDGTETVRYPDSTLEEILSETYGVIVYQEQVMQIAQVYGGYSLGDADNLRRAMGKKKADVMAVERERFVEGAVKKGHPRQAADQIFQQMETFAAYGFNKSHSAAYALISYQTAWLKTHHPTEFLAALLTLEMGDTDKTYKNLSDCKGRDISVLEPDVNESVADFTVVTEGIRFGLAAVKGVGEKAVESIIEVRGDSPFLSLADFCRRVNSAQVNKRVIESLVKAGAFDSISVSRAKLCASLDASMAWAQRVADDESAGQMGLFSSSDGTSQPEPPLAEVEEFSVAERLQAEHEMLGFYISGHPLDEHATDLGLLAPLPTGTLASRRDQETVRVAGVTNTVRLKNSKKGDRYATFNIEDPSGVIEVIAWPRVYKECEEAIVGNAPVLITGTLEIGDAGGTQDTEESEGFQRKPQVIASEILTLAEMRRRVARYVDISMDAARMEPSSVSDLKKTLALYPGDCRTYLKVVRQGASETLIELPDTLAIDPCDDLLMAVDKLLGPGSTALR